MNQCCKRIFDVILAMLGVILWAMLHPLLVFIIKRDSPGPVFYRQSRLGLHGKPFTICKYRTMVVDAEADGCPRWAEPEDSRITPSGHWLRRWGLDELPQFWSVLKGEMSVVGPRPEREYFYKKYPQLHGERLSVKPGITGLAQVSQRYTRDENDIRIKLDYDHEYIRKRSLGVDISIMLSTIALLMRGRDI